MKHETKYFGWFRVSKNENIFNKQCSTLNWSHSDDIDNFFSLFWLAKLNGTLILVKSKFMLNVCFEKFENHANSKKDCRIGNNWKYFASLISYKLLVNFSCFFVLAAKIYYFWQIPHCIHNITSAKISESVLTLKISTSTEILRARMDSAILKRNRSVGLANVYIIFSGSALFLHSKVKLNYIYLLWRYRTTRVPTPLGKPGKLKKFVVFDCICYICCIVR